MLTVATAARENIGGTGHLRPDETHAYRIVWVEEHGLSSFNRAHNNGDHQGMNRAMATFETLRIYQDTTVRVTDRNRVSMQVEALVGHNAGRRGWTNPDAMIP